MVRWQNSYNVLIEKTVLRYITFFTLNYDLHCTGWVKYILIIMDEKRPMLKVNISFQDSERSSGRESVCRVTTLAHMKGRAEEKFSGLPPLPCSVSQPHRSCWQKGQVTWHGPAALSAAWPFLLQFPQPAKQHCFCVVRWSNKR